MEMQSKYVTLRDGKIVPRHLLKPVRKGLFQGGQQETSLEIDEIALLDNLIRFVTLDNGR